MFHFHANLDTYGKVKTVQGTPIVTRFFAVNGMPFYPLASYYFAGIGETRFEYYTEGKAVQGLPLARLSRFSVLMAYFRGLCAALFLVGCLIIFPVVMILTGERLDDFAIVMTRCLLVCLVAGACGGLLSYLPIPTSWRETAIRRCCGELLGICADPALVREDAALAIALEMNLHPGRVEDIRHLPTGDAEKRLALLCELVLVRASMASSAAADGAREALERQTDSLLDRLDNR